MKTLKIVIIIMLLSQVFVSCEKELNLKPISTLSVDQFYKSAGDFEQAVNGTYAVLKYYPNWVLLLSEARSDNTYAHVDGQREFEQIGNFLTAISTIPSVNNPWYQCYIGIQRANTVMEQFEKNKDVQIDSQVKDRMTGEIKFLRAFFYFNLVRFYGEVPIVTKTITVAESFSISRSPVEDVYNTVIIPDLTDAINLLPDKPDVAGRAYKDAARGLLASVYLTRSGPTHDINGPGLNSNEYNKVIELINQVTSGGWVDNYKSIFSLTNENNKDIIFDVQFMPNTSGYGQSYCIVLTSEPFTKSIGLPSWSGNPGSCNASNQLYNLYDATDVRRDFSIKNGFIDEGGAPRPDKVIIKFITFDNLPSTSDGWGLNFPVIRYTDLQMMKAEAILKGGTPGTQADVDAIVNMVRTRAGISTLTNVTLDQLLDERRKEFIGEGIRWFDLIRMPDIVERMNNWRTVDDIYNTIAPMKNDFIIYPIPATEMDVKNGLYEQNPGY